jgi:hypothetical protein
MSESSSGFLLLVIVVAMVVLDRFEAWCLLVRHPRPARAVSRRPTVPNDAGMSVPVEGLHAMEEQPIPAVGMNRRSTGRAAAVALMAATWTLAILAELFAWPAR